MEFDTLLNIRFNRQTGPFDLEHNEWDYKNLGFNEWGKFNGTAGKWNGEDTSFAKVNGKSLNIAATVEFTISLWFNIPDIYSQSNKIFLLYDGNEGQETTKNTVYLTNSSIGIIDNEGHILEATDITYQESWNYLAIIRKRGITRIFLNGNLVSENNQNIIKEILFDSIRLTIGCGISSNGEKVILNGYLDDIVIMATAIPNLETNVDIPTDYLTNYLDPKSDVDIDGWEDTEHEYSRYDEIVDVTEDKRSRTATVIGELENGLCPYVIYPKYKLGNPYFANQTYTASLDRNILVLHISGVKNNALYTGKAPSYFRMDMVSAYHRSYVSSFLLFIDKKFIPWSRITIVRSDKYFTLLIKGFSRDFVFDSLHIICIPFAISYSEEGDIDDSAKIEFIFNEEGLSDNNGRIYIGNLDQHTSTIIYRDQTFNKFPLNIGLDHKITKNNMIVFDSDGYLDLDVNIKTYAGNIVTITDSSTNQKSVKTLVVTYYHSDASEDYINKFPNKVFARQIAAEEDTDIDISDIDVDLLRNEFDFTHSREKLYEDNITNSISYIWNYDKNKYDKVYEDIRPVNIIEYNAADILAMANDAYEVTMSRDIYELDDPHNQTFPVIFQNGEIPSYYCKATYTDHTFTFVPNGLKAGDTFEIVYFRNIRNELIPLDKTHKDEDDYLNISPSYIPIDDIVVYTDKLGETQLYPVLYTYDYINNKIILKYDKYLDTNLYIGSVNQFHYDIIEIFEDSNRIWLNNTFKSCYNPNRYLFFLNGRLVNQIYYKVLIPSLTNANIQYKCIYSMITLHPGDRVEIIYVGSNSIGINQSFVGDLMVKHTTTFAIEDNQSVFVIPLPFANYSLENNDSVAVFRHGLYKDKSSYYIYEENGVWYIKFLDIDDESVMGEEVTFLFPYYTTNLTIDESPNNSNSIQILTRYVHVIEEVSTITFPSDSMGNIITKDSILIFAGTKIVPKDEYEITGPNTITLNTPVSNIDACMVIVSDRYELAYNTAHLDYVEFDITEKGQNCFNLPYEWKENSYMVFFNSTLINPSHITVVNNILIIDYKYNYTRAGDKIYVFCITDSSTPKNTINWYPINLELLYTDSIDIPNFNSSYSLNNSSMMLFINDEFISPSMYSLSGRTIKFNKEYERGDSVIIYLAYKTLNRAYVPYENIRIGENTDLVFTERQVEAMGDNQSTFDIPYPLPVYTDTPFIVFVRGMFVAKSDYYVNNTNTQITFNQDRDQIRQGDIVTFVFCNSYGNLPVIKEEYTYDIPKGKTTIDMPDMYKADIEYNNRMLLFYGSLYIDSRRYTVNSVDRMITFNDFPYVDDNNRQVTLVFFYSGSSSTGTATYIPQSGYLRLDQHKIKRNYNKEMYMFFVNGKKIAKSQIMDITNYLKKITVDIKTRFGLEIITCSPLVSEFKNRFSEVVESDTVSVNITQSPHQTIKVRANGIVHTNSFRVEKGTVLDPFIEPEIGYKAGTFIGNLSRAAKINSSNTIEFKASDAKELPLVPVNIHQQSHQVIKVQCNGNVYTTSFFESPGSLFYATVESTNPRYTPGVLNITKGVIQDDMVDINVTAAKIVMCSISVKDKNLDHQKISISIFNELDKPATQVITEPGEYEVPYNSYMIISLIPDKGYDTIHRIGRYKENTPIRITENIELIPEEVQGPNRLYIYIPDNISNQTIYAQINDKYYTQTCYGYYGDSYSITVEPDKGYEPGEIVCANELSGTLKNSISITISDAKKIITFYNFSIEDDGKSTIYATLSTGTKVNVGQTVKVPSGTSYEITIIPANGYTTPKLNSMGGMITSNTHINILKQAEELTENEYKNMAHIVFSLKNGVDISAYSKSTNRMYTQSFYTNPGTTLYFNYTCPDGMFIRSNIGSELLVQYPGEYIVTTTSPLPVSQKDKTIYLGNEKEETVTIYTDNENSVLQFIHITYGDIDEINPQVLKDIPIGENVTITLDGIPKAGQLYINGVKIVGNIITIPVGSFTDDILTQSTTLKISCSLSVQDSNCTIEMADDLFEHQKIIVLEYDGENEKEISLPYTIDVSKISDDYEFRIHSEAEEGYIPGICNYNIIKPIEGAKYIIYCSHAKEVD